MQFAGNTRCHTEPSTEEGIKTDLGAPIRRDKRPSDDRRKEHLIRVEKIRVYSSWRYAGDLNVMLLPFAMERFGHRENVSLRRAVRKGCGIRELGGNRRNIEYVPPFVPDHSFPEQKAELGHGKDMEVDDVFDRADIAHFALHIDEYPRAIDQDVDMDVLFTADVEQTVSRIWPEQIHYNH